MGHSGGRPLGLGIHPSYTSSRAMERAVVYVACTLAAVMTMLRLGKDLPWDTIHYHLYAGFSALHNRFAQDYFAAGPQSYDNPYAYVPFYLLVASGLTSLQISLILAVFQSAILWVSYEIALFVCPTEGRWTRLAIGVCAAALAFANPILMQQFGTSFSDITTGELVLISWLLLSAALTAPSLSKVLWAGLIAGIAVGLKATNAVDAVAAVALVALLPAAPAKRVKYAAAYCLSVVVGFAVVSAPWSYHLERKFGNPVFPLANNIFRSPYFTTQPLLHYRFMPAGILDALWRPFAIAKPMFMIQEELRAPDVRYAALVLLAMVAFVMWLWRRLHMRRSHNPTRLPMPASRRVLLALGLGVAAAWTGWLTASGNGRYFIPMACIAAVVVVGLLFHLFEKWPKARNYLFLGLFVVQGVQLAMGAAYRWNPVPWTPGPWLQVQMPRKLATEPDLYLTVGFQSNAFLAAYLNPRSGLVNFTGSYPVAAEDANGKRVLALIHHFAPHLRVLISGKRLNDDPRSHGPQLSRVNTQLRPFGLEVDSSDCSTIAVQGLPPEFEFTFGSEPSDRPPSTTPTSYLVSCRLVPGASGDPMLLASKASVDKVLDRLEDECPQLFQPSRAVSEPLGQGWARSYINTDLIAWVSRGWVKFDDPIYSTGLKFIGRESDWLKGPVPINCGRRNGHFYVEQREAQSNRRGGDDVAP